MRRIVIYVFVLCSCYGFSQETVSKNLIYSEYKFSGYKSEVESVISNTINYERYLFKPFDWLSNSVKIGVGAWSPVISFAPSSDDITNKIEATATLNFVTGTKHHHLEMQLGASILSSKVTEEAFLQDPNDQTISMQSSVTNNVMETLAVVNAGYRYQKPEGGFVFKALVGTYGIVTIGLGYSW